MSQDEAIILCLKVVLVTGFAALTGWVAVYTRLTRGGAWRNPIGLTFILMALLIAGLFVPQILSLFFHLNRLTSHIAAWADVALIGLVTPVEVWRTIVFIRLDRLGRLPRNGHRGTGGDGGS